MKQADASPLFKKLPINVEDLRQRLKKMTYNELMKFGREATEGCKSTAGKPREVFLVQLAEARTEQKRRQTEKRLPNHP